MNGPLDVLGFLELVENCTGSCAIGKTCEKFSDGFDARENTENFEYYEVVK